MTVATVGQEIKEKASWEGSVEELKGLVSERALTGETMLLNMGPHHPSTHGVLRLLLELDGEEIVTCLPDVGYLHTGIEKNIEAKTYEKAVTLTDRTDYLAPMSNNMAFCMAVEKLVELDVPERAQIMRVICLELTRLNSHLVWLGTHAIDLGAMSVFLYCFRPARTNLADVRDAVRPAHDDQLHPSRRCCGAISPRNLYPALEEFPERFPVEDR